MTGLFLVIGKVTSFSALAVRRLARWSNARPASRCFCSCRAWRGTGRVGLSRMGQLLPASAEAVRDAIAATISNLPTDLRRSLTWDQGAEMVQHAQLRLDTGLDIYFCDPQSPWQRGSNENTNGLLRQYFPKGTDLSKHGAEELRAVAHALNTRPRKTLGWQTPAEALDRLVKQDMIDGVATTG